MGEASALGYVGAVITAARPTTEIGRDTMQIEERKPKSVFWAVFWALFVFFIVLPIIGFVGCAACGGALLI